MELSDELLERGYRRAHRGIPDFVLAKHHAQLSLEARLQTSHKNSGVCVSSNRRRRNNRPPEAGPDDSLCCFHVSQFHHRANLQRSCTFPPLLMPSALDPSSLISYNHSGPSGRESLRSSNIGGIKRACINHNLYNETLVHVCSLVLKQETFPEETRPEAHEGTVGQNSGRRRFHFFVDVTFCDFQLAPTSTLNARQRQPIENGGDRKSMEIVPMLTMSLAHKQMYLRKPQSHRIKQRRWPCILRSTTSAGFFGR